MGFYLILNNEKLRLIADMFSAQSFFFFIILFISSAWSEALSQFQIILYCCVHAT